MIFVLITVGALVVLLLAGLYFQLGYVNQQLESIRKLLGAWDDDPGFLQQLVSYAQDAERARRKRDDW